MYKNKNLELVNNNLINILEEKENNLYWLTKEKINKNISTTLKEWCRLYNFNYINMNSSHIINYEDNFYLICNYNINIVGDSELVIEKTYSSNKYEIFKIKKIERPIIVSIKKLYKFIKDVKKELEFTFVEKIKLEDFLYCNDLDKYSLLCSLKNSLDDYKNEIKGIKISVINLFFGKSPYLFKGNEINTIEELMLLKERFKWSHFSQL
ncbi:hypothetical protein HMPREF0946_01689 [Fusobacterium vincentii 3_1_36A2]|uniref:Uncharacterized protein n=1 Tax=Fusobacterium vincentii 3_1_36A2 TaxID=469604 RepID=C7XSA2_FUSVC|nr:MULTISPECIES: hypothetical protein [Fusobacterium]EEU31828.1 hypothetical protein HMPREF0946_01689 [Fusobacterium vincentii 3_1_36A2]